MNGEHWNSGHYDLLLIVRELSAVVGNLKSTLLGKRQANLKRLHTM